jgi:seryl-tRNA synthetase
MFDINFIRNNPQLFADKAKKRGIEIEIDKILDLDKEKRKNLSIIEDANAKKNKIAKEIGILYKDKNTNAEKIDAMKNESNAIDHSIQSAEFLLEKIERELHDMLSHIPNMISDDTPLGKDEDDNIEIRKFGTPKNFDFQPLSHDEIGEKLGMMDFERAAKISGSRFVVLSSHMARLERSIKNFMLDVHTKEFGYTEHYVPHIVNENAMYGTGQLPKFDNGYKVEDKYLIPTSEVPLTNLVRESILSEDELPLRFVAYSQCFRSEAGAASKDTRGMIRQHQFPKVEMVSITKQEDSYNELERMVSCAEGILQKLELPYRIIQLCSADIGFSGAKTYDLEVWIPSQKKYREISSCSNTLDFQARRMMARYKDLHGKNLYVHTLNGSGLAVGRTLVAILENYQNQDGSITIPSALVPYMGVEKIG